MTVALEGSSRDAVQVQDLTYAYAGYQPVIKDLSLHLPAGSRCLLLGANGAGKSSLLQILAGKHLVGQDTIRILGRSAFHDIELTASGELSYLGPQWRRNIAFAGNDVPLQGDISAGKMIYGVEGVAVARRERLIDLLDIDLDWRLNKVSDGQRRRVQICLGLLKAYEVLLLDEITVDMDVVGRLDLLGFFEEECRERGATIIYATHIFDGLETWLTHVAYISEGKLLKGAVAPILAADHLKRHTKDNVRQLLARGFGGEAWNAAAAGGPVLEVQELQHGDKLLHVVEAWLRAEQDRRQREDSSNPDARLHRAGAALRKEPVMPSKHMAFFR